MSVCIVWHLKLHTEDITDAGVIGDIEYIGSIGDKGRIGV